MNPDQNYAPNAHWYYRPYCWFLLHDRPIDEKGWIPIHCQRCGSDGRTPIRTFLARSRYKLAYGFLWLANKTVELKNTPHNKPYFRPTDTKWLKGMGTKHSCDAYSYEFLQSMMKQEGEGYTLGQLFDESGWIEIGEDNAEEMVELINASFEAEANKQEREKTMKMMNGELPNE